MRELGELIGASPAIESLKANIRRLVSRGSGTGRLPAVLLSGETGTGKGLVANLLHRQGPRAGRPFVAVNCAAIPDTLMESELFGYERGAFTGARQSKPGLFQTAHTGSIFLDEVGLLSEPLQAKLLKLVEERTVRRLGGTRSEPVDVWVLSATNADLEADVRNRRFREDLYHRLSVVVLPLPPLRKRGDDILLLAEHFLSRMCADYGLQPLTLAEDARRSLMEYPWPGNIRELANAIERAALMCESSRITADLLGLKELPATVTASAAGPPAPVPASVSTLDEIVRNHLEAVLARHRGNISRTAAALGVARNTLRSHLRKLGLPPGTHDAGPRAPARPAVPARAEGDEDATIQERAAPVASISRGAGRVPVLTAEVVRWEQRRVTVLRTEVLEREPADDLASASNILLASVMEKIRSFGGRVEEVSPRTVEGSFGVDPIDDAARRAALCALAIRMTVTRAQGAAPPDDLRVLIHTGTVRIGYAAGTARIDRESKLEMTRSFDALSSAGREGPIVVTAGTAAFLGRQFVLESREGSRTQGGESYRLIRHKIGELSREAGGLFVGRQVELELLQARAGAALAGRGQVVALVGGAGVGKTRLAREFAHSAGARPFRLLESGSTYASVGVYRPVAELLKHLFHIRGADDPARIRERVLATLNASEVSGASLLPAILSLLDVPAEDTAWDRLQPAARRERTLEAFKRLLLAESRVEPVLLLFEDLHSIDTESQALLDVAVQSLPAARLFVLVSYRPEYRHGWRNFSYYTQFPINPLPAGEATQLLDHLLGEDPVLGPLKLRLVDWTEGNPFFLEESVRALEETGTLAGSPGAYTLVRPVGTIEVPATVEDVLAARFDRLAPADRRVLQSAAIIGRSVPFALLAAITDSTDSELRAALGRLQAAEVVYECTRSSELEFMFKHGLTHEVAYRSLLPEVRRHLHARTLVALEAGAAGAATDQTDRLAHHAFHAELWSKAVEYLRQSGRRALLASANGEAVEIFERALVALRQLPETPATLQPALALRLTLRDALWSLGQIGKIRDQLVEAEAIAHRIGDQRGLGRVACYFCHYFWAVGDLPSARAAGERALALATTLGDELLAAETELYQGVVFLTQGDAERAMQALHRAQQRLDPAAVGRPGTANRSTALWLLVRCFLTRALAELGRFEEGIAAGEEALLVSQRNGTAFGLATALAGLGSLYLRKAEPETATPLLERGLELCRAYSVNNWLPSIGASLGCAYAQSGRAAEGVRLLEEAVELDRALGIVATASLWRIYLGEAYLRAGRVEEATALARRVLAMCRTRGEFGYEAWALLLLGLSMAGGSSTDREEGHASCLQALEAADRLGMRPLAVRCALALARLHGGAGETTAASTYRARAGRLVAELSMPLALLDSA